MMRFALLLLLAAWLGLAPAAVRADEPVKPVSQPRKFTRLFGWGQLTSDACAKALRDIGLTDLACGHPSPEQVAWGKKYGIRLYAGFSPHGDHAQVITPAERTLQDRLNGADIPLAPDATPAERAAREAQLLDRRRQLKSQSGGEPLPDAPEGDVLWENILCFSGEKAFEKSRQRLKELCAIEGIDGISFDYIGYSNFRGCYCETCLGLYRSHLAAHNLPDNVASQNAFYLQQLVDYNNAMAQYVKSLRPAFKTMTHVYPVFIPEPLYGNRLNVDFCGQTAAWYFLWPEEKIFAYSRTITGKQNAFVDGVKGVPFIGYYSAKNAPDFPPKSPARVELELRAILDGGADAVMVCSVNDVLDDPDIAVIFKKYCAP